MAQPLPWASLGLCLLKLPKEMAPLQAMASQVLTAEETAFKNRRLYVSRKLSFLLDCQIRRHTVVHSIFLQFLYFFGIR